MDRKVGIPWTEELFYELITFVDKNALARKMKDPEKQDEATPIKVNEIYPLYKDLFGVKIQYGHLRIQKILLSDALDILNSFALLTKERDTYVVSPIVNIDAINELGVYLELERPDLESIQGYITNGELVNIKQDVKFVIQLKYKDSPDNIFYIYKIYFLQYLDELFLVIEKNI